MCITSCAAEIVWWQTSK